MFSRSWPFSNCVIAPLIITGQLDFQWKKEDNQGRYGYTIFERYEHQTRIDCLCLMSVFWVYQPVITNSNQFKRQVRACARATPCQTSGDKWTSPHRAHTTPTCNYCAMFGSNTRLMNIWVECTVLWSDWGSINLLVNLKRTLPQTDVFPMTKKKIWNIWEGVACHVLHKSGEVLNYLEWANAY